MTNFDHNTIPKTIRKACARKTRFHRMALQPRSELAFRTFADE